MGKQVKRELSFYYSTNSRRIHLFIGGDCRASVSNDPDRVNYHPELFRKLANLLREEGKPAPPES